MRVAAVFLAARLAAGVVSGSEEKKQYGTQLQGVITKLEELKADAVRQKKTAQTWITKFNAHALQFYHSKTEDLKNTNQQINSEEARLARAEAAIKAASEAIARLENQLVKLAADMKQINTVRKEEHDIFLTEQKEASAAIAACEKAVGILAPKAGNTGAAATAFLQRDVDALVQLENAVPVQHRKGDWDAVSMLLEMAQGVVSGNKEIPQGDTSAWMGGGPKRVIAIIEEVKQSIEEHLQEVRSAETANVNAHEMKLSELQQTEKFTNVQKDKEEAAKAEADANKASAEGQLGGTGSGGGLRQSAKDLKKHLSDQKVVVDRTEREYAAAQVARANEIKMIDQAIQIITNKVSSKVVNELQQSSSFIQIKSEKKQQDIDSEKQRRLAKFLQEKGIGFNSKILIQMAQLASATPFDKVVKMIKQLILKLTNEVSETQEVAGWCDARLTAYKDSLERAVDKVTQSQICVDAKTSEREGQSQTIDEVRSELKKATEELAELRSDYSESKSDNDSDIADQKSASEGLEEALEVLRSFYQNSDNQSALSTGNMDLSDETGNDTGGFAGDFAAAEGTGADQNTNTVGSGNRIVDFLENILGDIKADIQERTTAAALSKTDFQTTERDMVGEKASLETQLQSDIGTLGQLKDKLNDCKQDLEMGHDSKREQDEYYANVLEKKCVTDDVTFQQRSEKRQAEITSLQEALEILENA